MTEQERQMYWGKVPEVLRDNPDFAVFMELAATEFGIDIANIERFTDLIDPDKVPAQFIKSLGEFIGYEHKANIPDDFSREALQRIQTVYSMRGSDEAILLAANHGDNPNWIGGHLFVPGSPISPETSGITFTAEKLFTHCRSKHSGSHKFSDRDIYRSGVILIKVPFINDEIREAVRKSVPAGVRYYFTIGDDKTPVA